ncbi:MAG: 4Fe-4S ferredoxin, iron-sulfur binding domain protein [Bryobacterales bacterium]|nr:4Fe-4S ferredoxin, iron-sulfur binding domain protein [Bryobacterales bacterium]
MVITLALIAVVYVRGWYQLRSALPTVLSEWRLAAFMSGVFSLWAAVGSPLGVLDHQLLLAHMVQHLLLMTVAAPLILLGAPAMALLYGLPRRFVPGVLDPVLRFPPLSSVGRIVTHPVFCWLASTAVVIGWHIPALFQLGMKSEGWHEFQHASFFAAGLLFWWPVVQPWPSLERWPGWSIPLYLFLATLPCDALSAFLTFCDRVVYPHYLTPHRLFDISPLGDQEAAGALMWVCVTFAYLVPAAVVTIQMLSPRATTLELEARDQRSLARR